MKKKKVYIVALIYDQIKFANQGTFDTVKEAEEYITTHWFYKRNAPMYVIPAYKYKSEQYIGE